MAINAYNTRQIKSILKAAHIFNVPESTICSRLQGVTPCIEKRANNYILIVSEEETLIKWAFIADKYGLPI